MSNNCVLQWTKLHLDAIAPKKASIEAAGFDLSAPNNFSVLPLAYKIVETGIQIKLPQSCYGRIAPRSSLSIRGIHIGGGVIDADYTGEIKVIMYNMTHKVVQVKKGDRIAQLICEKIEYPVLEEVDRIEAQTERGSGCFGSTN